jgi:hypothetical protein
MRYKTKFTLDHRERSILTEVNEGEDLRLSRFDKVLNIAGYIMILFHRDFQNP